MTKDQTLAAQVKARLAVLRSFDALSRQSKERYTISAALDLLDALIERGLEHTADCASRYRYGKSPCNCGKAAVEALAEKFLEAE